MRHLFTYDYTDFTNAASEGNPYTSYGMLCSYETEDGRAVRDSVKFERLDYVTHWIDKRGAEVDLGADNGYADHLMSWLEARIAEKDSDLKVDLFFAADAHYEWNQDRFEQERLEDAAVAFYHYS